MPALLLMDLHRVLQGPHSLEADSAALAFFLTAVAMVLDISTRSW